MSNKIAKKIANTTYFMCGKHAVLAALDNQQRKIKKIFCTAAFASSNPQLINKYQNNVVIVETKFLTSTLGLGHNHQGIAAQVYSIFANNIGEINTNLNCKVAILDQITDPQNIGAIIRSAAAFGFTAIILPQDNTPFENATIAKIASGTLELVKIIKVANLHSAMHILKNQGFWLIGFDNKAKTYLSKKLLSGKVALVLGAEDKGLRRLTKAACDYIVKLPMTPKVESLNVASAASIAFYMAYALDIDC